MESLNEAMFLTVFRSEKVIDVQKRLNDQLPAGIFIKKCEINAGMEDTFTVYRVELASGEFNPESINRFTQAESFLISRINPKGKEKIIDLKAIDARIRLQSPHILELSMRYDPKNILRPADVLHPLLGLTDQQQKSARVIKC
jgi:hypothetical protein